MKNKTKILKNILVSSIGLSTLLGCGSSGSTNDQGVSFTLYAVFSDSACATQFGGGSVQLSEDTETNGTGAGVVSYLGLQNNLVQGIRTRRATLKYYVEGGQIQPPDTSQALGVLLAPGSTPNSNIDLPTGFGTSNVGCAGIELVPPEILSFLNLNRNSFPELPFKMRVEVAVNGVGTAGDNYTTNAIDVPLEIVEDNIISPTPGDTTGSSSSSSALEGESTSTGTEVTDTNTEIIPVIPGTDTPAV